MYRAACPSDHAHPLLPGAQQNCRGTTKTGDFQKLPGEAVFRSSQGPGGVPRDAPVAGSDLPGHHVQGVPALGGGGGGNAEVPTNDRTTDNQ